MDTARRLISGRSKMEASAAEPIAPPAAGAPEDNRLPQPPPECLIRAAVMVSRAGWFRFLRRVFRHQNGPSSGDHPPAPDPFDSGTWFALETLSSSSQVILIAATVAMTRDESPVWPLRLWLSTYSLATLLGLLRPLYARFRRLGRRSESTPDRCPAACAAGKRALDLFLAVWFVTGNVWVLGSRGGAFRRAPRLHALCFGILAWNAARYTLPFVLFLLLCCCVPAASRAVGFNINSACDGRGASDDSISSLPRWRFEDGGELGGGDDPSTECCICLSRYRRGEEVRRLPCSHCFHLRCVDEWLRIMSSCPLCKSDLESSINVSKE